MPGDEIEILLMLPTAYYKFGVIYAVQINATLWRIELEYGVASGDPLFNSTNNLYKSTTGMSKEYIYNERRLLQEVKSHGVTVEKYEYDGLGRRIKVIRGNETTINLYLGNNIIYEKTTSGNQVTREIDYIVINGVYIAKIVKEGNNQSQILYMVI